MHEQLLEEMSEVCHDEWVSWSRSVSKELAEAVEVLKRNNQILNELEIENEESVELVEKLEGRLKRWEKLWIPYEELSDEMKDSDRKYAQKMLDLAIREI